MKLCSELINSLVSGGVYFQTGDKYIMNSNSPTQGQMIAYAAPMVGSYFFYNPMWAILPGIYVKYFGLELSSVAAVVLFIRLFDGVTDPTIGYLADRHRIRQGSRKPWVIAGSIGVVVSCYFLFIPPGPVTTGYYLCWSLLYFLALTLSDIPHWAWGSEITMDYNGRARVYSIRNIVSTLGYLAFSALPLLPLYSTGEYTPEVLADAVYIGAVLTFFGLIWCYKQAPDGVVSSVQCEKDSFYLLWESLIHNQPLLIYFSGYLCFGLGLGMWTGLLFIYLDTYLGIGDRLALILTVATFAGVLSTPLWLKLIERTSKHFTWALGVGCFFLQLLFSSLVSTNASWLLTLMLVTIAYIGFACHNVAAISTLGDIIDFAQLKFRRNRGATYVAFNNVFYKWGLGMGSGVSMGIAGLMGFDPNVTTNSESAILGLKIGYIYLPALFSLLGALLILATPITRKRHKVIERRLSMLAGRATEKISKAAAVG